MSTMESVKAQIRTLIDSANETTGNSDATLTDAMNSLMSGYGQGGSSDLVKYVTFMSWDGSTELFKMPVLSGDDCKDPITHGDIESPTKESDVQYHYTYSGWSTYKGGSANTSALKKVTTDKTVYASFTTSPVYYTVSFYDGDTLVKTEEIAYGESSDYIYTKDGFAFVCWTPEPTNITGDMSCYVTMESVIEHKWEEFTANHNARGGVSLVYDGKLYLIGGGKTKTDADAKKFAYWTEGSQGWTSLKSLPYYYNSGVGAVVYNNEIHVIGFDIDSDNIATEHYKWNGSDWVFVSTLPRNSSNMRAVLYNEEIHLIGGNGTYHYKWDGNEWVTVSTLPISTDQGNVVVYDNEIHLLGCSSDNTAHYKWNGSEWILVDRLATGLTFDNMDKPIEIEGKIHYFDPEGSKKHYRLDGNEWTLMGDTLPYAPYCKATLVVYNGRLYMFGQQSTNKALRW